MTTTNLTVATGQAVGGAFICYGMFGDRIYALDSASVGLMPVEAMSAVTKIPVPVLRKLSKTMPSLEFGARPFALLGGVLAVLASGGTVSIGSVVGFVTLFGITVRNSIMLLSHYRQLERLDQYPEKVRKLLSRLNRFRLDKLFHRLL